MKLAPPIALVVCGVVIIAILMSHRHWELRTWDNAHADENEIAEAKQQWFQKNPDLKAEDVALNQKYQQTEAAWRQASHDRYEARAALVNHDLKVHDELIKADPLLQPVYDRLDLDKQVPFEWGEQQLAVEYGGGWIPGGHSHIIEYYIELSLGV